MRRHVCTCSSFYVPLQMHMRMHHSIARQKNRVQGNTALHSLTTAQHYIERTARLRNLRTAWTFHAMQRGYMCMSLSLCLPFCLLDCADHICGRLSTSLGRVFIHIDHLCFFLSRAVSRSLFHLSSAYLSVCLSVRLSVCLSVSVCVCLPACLHVCLSACQSVCLSIYSVLPIHSTLFCSTPVCSILVQSIRFFSLFFVLFCSFLLYSVLFCSGLFGSVFFWFILFCCIFYESNRIQSTQPNLIQSNQI